MARMNATQAFAFDSATVSSTALTLTDVGFSAAQVTRANRARVTCLAQPVLYRYDGGVPAASTGHALIANETVVIDGQSNLAELRFIRAGGTDGTVCITLEE